MAHEDIKYEQACILYNLGELPEPFPAAPAPAPAPQPCQPGMEDARIRTRPLLPNCSASTSFLGHEEPPCWGEGSWASGHTGLR